MVTVAGAPVTPEPAAEKGFKIERLNYTLAGDPVDPKRSQTEHPDGRGAEGHRSAAAIRPRHPRGLSPRGFRDRQSASRIVRRYRHADWITDAIEPVNTEFRDDRFTSAFERKKDDAPVFTVAYVVRAVAPGKYVRPQAVVEDMYRPDRYGRTATESVEVTAAK